MFGGVGDGSPKEKGGVGVGVEGSAGGRWWVSARRHARTGRRLWLVQRHVIGRGLVGWCSGDWQTGADWLSGRWPGGWQHERARTWLAPLQEGLAPILGPQLDGARGEGRSGRRLLLLLLLLRVDG